jgi:capsular exopolysaccharide synthesis family protein
MSKISKALEKAAREGALRERERPTVTVPSTRIASDGSRLSVASAASNVDPHIVVYHDRNNPIAEQYRMLRTHLHSIKQDKGLSSLLVTSAFSGEGKTVTALNLALTLAQNPDCRVLLIDADLRKGTIKRWLGLDRSIGLSDVLCGRAQASDALVRIESTHLTVMPSGRTMQDPSDKLHSDLMQSLIAQFKRQFDYVVIDSPPLLLVTDPGILSQRVDGVLLVVRAGHTPRRSVLQAHGRLDQVKANTVGSILTYAEYYNPLYQKYYRAYLDEHDQKSNGSGSLEHPTA